tara:strand:- start:27 stop:143 length:117 start_codon:yes stop_codon:yes gene_type:complete
MLRFVPSLRQFFGMALSGAVVAATLLNLIVVRMMYFAD